MTAAVYTIDIDRPPKPARRLRSGTLRGVAVAIQCKFQSTPVGNDAVQEAIAAKQFFDCHGAAVMSNQSFTPSARRLADKCGVRLMTVDPSAI
jgi:HJR/Mrr/RecB family endonuclease